MRRFTDVELGRLTTLARRGRTGPLLALDELWDLILRDAEGMTLSEAAETPGQFSVSDYAIAADQALILHQAMTRGRRLTRREIIGIRMTWLNQSPAVYDDPELLESESDLSNPDTTA